MLSHRINLYRIDIYYRYYHELMQRFDGIVNDFSGLIESLFDEGDMIVMKNQLLDNANKVKEEGDFVMMSDLLTSQFLPIVIEIENISNETRN